VTCEIECDVIARIDRKVVSHENSPVQCSIATTVHGC